MQGVNPVHLLAAALVLTKHDAYGRPRQAYLRRAMSTTYYAMFHCLSSSNADVLVGGSRRTSEAWMSAYRALDHGPTYRRCDSSSVATFPAEIRRFAAALRTLKESREDADYNPAAKFSRFDVYQHVLDAFSAIENFRQLSRFAAPTVRRARSSPEENSIDRLLLSLPDAQSGRRAFVGRLRC